MTLSIHPVNLDDDNSGLIEAMRRHLTPLSNGRRYTWLYQENPEGPAKLWSLVESTTQSIVGSAGLVPRRMYVQQQEVRCALFVDLWVAPEYRTLGPALKLQRACLEEVAGGAYSFGYDFPHANMLAVYSRLGIAANNQLIRFTKPLNLRKRFGPLAELPVLGELLVGGANRVLRSKDALYRHRTSCTIAELTGNFDEDVTALTRRNSSTYGPCVARTASYLNWRYQGHFHSRYRILTAHQNGSLVGYVVFVEQPEARIVDLFAVDDHRIKADLLFAALDVLRGRGAENVDACCFGSHAQARLLTKAGFFSREMHPIIVSSPGSALAFDRKQLFLMDGDRES